NTEIKFVTGYSGIGKTSIVNELQLKIDQSKGNFIKGKYDQYNRATPYSGIFSAFEDFFARLAQEKNRKEIFVFRKDTLDVLDQEGQVLIDVMPTLKKLLGSQPPVDTLPESVAKSRFYRLFTGLLSVLATKENPLVMFVDDLQWADAASLNLMQDLLQSGQIPYFLMLGAYRDNEIDRAHILNFAIKELEKTKLSFSQLILKPLPAAACQELIIDTLNSNQEKTNDLTSMLIKKTEGNPFFLKQLLNKLYQDSQFKYKKKAWNWDLPEIRLLDIADNVVDFMMSQLAKEEIITQSYLTDAALIGNIFDFQTLKAIQTKPTSRAVLIRALLNAAATGYIIPLNFDIEKLTGESDEFYFKFAHDRIQQAAILLISEEERLNRSLAIARYRKELHKDQWSEKVFEIVPYYDQALPILLEIKRRDPDDLEIAIVAELNFMAACKSRLSVAYEEALLFARTAQILIHPKYWQKDFELTKDLYLQLAELEQINGEFKQAEKYFDECLKHFKKTEDIVDVYTKKVKLYTSSSEYQKAIAVGLKGLKMLGLRLKENPNMAKIGLNLLKVKSKLGLRKINSLLNLPEMKNEKALLAMKLMIETSTPAYQTDKNLVILIVLKMIMFSLKYGNNKDSGFAYMTYGILLSFGLNYPQGYEFGKLALDLNEKFKNIVLKPSLNEFFGSFICPWTHPLKEAIPYLKTAYQTGEETGDVYYAALAHCNHIGSLIYKGEYLNFTKENLLNFAKFIDKHKFKDTRLFFSLYKNFINFLISKDETYVFNEHKYSNENFFKEITKVKNENVLSNYYILKLMTLYYTQDFNNILHIAQKSEELIEYSRGLFQSTEHYFYYSLTITAMYQEFSKEDQAKYLKILKKNLSKFQAWNKHCAANFEAKLYLLQAELARLQGA
ncbi:AAA family ATPase, partial [bacterium]|nr:AAA family ATPase [bacterium]